MSDIVFVPDSISELVAAGLLTCGIMCSGVQEEPDHGYDHAPYIDKEEGIEMKEVYNERRKRESIKTLENDVGNLEKDLNKTNKEKRKIETEAENLRREVKHLEKELNSLKKKADNVSGNTSTKSNDKATVSKDGSKKETSGKSDEGKTESKSSKKRTESKDKPASNESADGGETFEATYYTAMCDTGCTGVTADGTDVSNTTTKNGKGIIATDPSVIPLGTTVSVDGEEYIAADTGGDIKENRIDILVGSKEQARSNGRHKVDVEVIE